MPQFPLMLVEPWVLIVTKVLGGLGLALVLQIINVPTSPMLVACANKSYHFLRGSLCVSTVYFLLLILVKKCATVWQHQLKKIS